MNQCPPGSQVFHWGRFEFFRKFAEIFANSCLSLVSTTPAKSCSAVSMTPAISPCHGFSVIAGVVDTGDKYIDDTGDQLSAVTTTRTPWRWGAAKDRKKLKGINLRYLRPPKSATAADDVIGTAMKSCIHTHPKHLDQRPLRPPKLNNAVLVCSSFGGLRGLRACEGPLRLFVAVSLTISAAVADFGGRS